MRTTTFPFGEMMPEPTRIFMQRRFQELAGLLIIGMTAALGIALASWSVSDPSLNHSTDAPVHNAFGHEGAIVADLLMQLIGVSAIAILAPLALSGWRILSHQSGRGSMVRLKYWILGIVAAAAVASLLPTTDRWPLPTGLGGVVGDAIVTLPKRYFSVFGLMIFGMISVVIAIFSLTISSGFMINGEADDFDDAYMEPRPQPKPDKTSKAHRQKSHFFFRAISFLTSARRLLALNPTAKNHDLDLDDASIVRSNAFPHLDDARKSLDSRREPRIEPSPLRGRTEPLLFDEIPSKSQVGDYTVPSLTFLTQGSKPNRNFGEDSLEQNARLLEGVLEDFSVKGDVISVHPGPVVTLYEFEPAPGIKSSRVIGLADDIARSMSAVSARVAVVPGRNAIGIELPNPRRETVYLRELVASPDFTDSKHKLAIALGKTIGGEPVIVDLAKMPHLLVAGTTGSGKSVAINTMILSLLYRLKPHECRLIMVDPKMLELSVYDGIPHLLTPVVTDPKKAVVALKWAVREMEDRYKKMSKLAVRNIDGFNARVTEAREKGEVISRTVQTGFDRETGEAIYEQEHMDLTALPYIVVIVDEMADLMMVAGKEIEGAIQRLAQMARAAGIHIIMATQRPSVDVITGTIKANFPTRISFQVTSKIDSRTILGEMGAEQLLGQGDMLHMAGGGRISRVHGPFVSDADVEKVVAHLKMQGQPDYLDAVTDEADADDEDADVSAAAADSDESTDLYDRAVSIVLRDKKCSTSYVQRRLSVGYNKAASLVERMEKEGVVGPANHAGKRTILVGGGVDRGAFDLGEI
jgi:S-DNA-T family DNA segregation ATPase FtsK/SpoIIIE